MNISSYKPWMKDQIEELVRVFFENSPSFRHLPPNVSKIMSLVYAAQTNSDKYYARAVVDGEELVGGMVGMIVAPFYSDVLVAVDHLIATMPNRQGEGAGKMLVADFEEWARHNGVRHVRLAQSTGTNVAATTAFYESQGYLVTGATAWKEI